MSNMIKIIIIIIIVVLCSLGLRFLFVHFGAGGYTTGLFVGLFIGLASSFLIKIIIE